MTETRLQVERPTSPHLQIYRWSITMAMSIAHRATGVALTAGTVLLAWWLMSAAAGPNAYANVQWFVGTFIGRLILFGYTWALLHHMFGGIRHFIWDLGYGFAAGEREGLAWANLVASVGATIFIWVVAYFVIGGL